MLPINFFKSLEYWKEQREKVIYRTALLRAKLKAPPGRYPEAVLAEARALLKSIEDQFPEFRKAKS